MTTENEDFYSNLELISDKTKIDFLQLKKFDLNKLDIDKFSLDISICKKETGISFAKR